ncbi:unnamed protein product, partial [Ascophyllum nodosum]
DRPPRIGGIEVGSDHPRWHNGCGDGQRPRRARSISVGRAALRRPLRNSGA